MVAFRSTNGIFKILKALSSIFAEAAFLFDNLPIFQCKDFKLSFDSIINVLTSSHQGRDRAYKSLESAAHCLGSCRFISTIRILDRKGVRVKQGVPKLCFIRYLRFLLGNTRPAHQPLACDEGDL